MNWFSGVSPSLGPFAGILSDPVRMFLALVWALGFAYVAFHLVVGVARLAGAKKSHRPVDTEEAGQGILWPLVGLIGLSAVPLIYAAVA